MTQSNQTLSTTTELRVPPQVSGRALIIFSIREDMHRWQHHSRAARAVPAH